MRVPDRAAAAIRRAGLHVPGPPRGLHAAHQRHARHPCRAEALQGLLDRGAASNRALHERGRVRRAVRARPDIRVHDARGNPLSREPGARGAREPGTGVQPQVHIHLGGREQPSRQRMAQGRRAAAVNTDGAPHGRILHGRRCRRRSHSQGAEKLSVHGRGRHRQEAGDGRRRLGLQASGWRLRVAYDGIRKDPHVVQGRATSREVQARGQVGVHRRQDRARHADSRGVQGLRGPARDHQRHRQRRRAPGAFEGRRRPRQDADRDIDQQAQHRRERQGDRERQARALREEDRHRRRRVPPLDLRGNDGKHQGGLPQRHADRIHRHPDIPGEQQEHLDDVRRVRGGDRPLLHRRRHPGRKRPEVPPQEGRDVPERRAETRRRAQEGGHEVI